MGQSSETAILVVDDEASLRDTFQILLSRAGYQPVVAVASFADAVRAVSARMFSLIVCDIVLESHSGIDLLKRFRQLGVTCPVVMVTGYPQVETAAEAVRLGAFDYLAKPVDKEALLKTARLALQHYNLEKEKARLEVTREHYRHFLETIFKSVSDAIISVDRALHIEKINEAAMTLLQPAQADLREGGNLTCLNQNPDLAGLPGEVREVIRSGSERSDLRFECFLDGNCKVLSCCISPLQDGSGSPAGAVLVIRDITQHEQVDYDHRSHFHKLIGASVVMQNLYRMIENIGRVESSVLITGESGTGKELVVHALHQESPRRNRPLIMVDCTAIPENLLESELFGHKRGAFTGAQENRMGRILQADGGTLFLDEIGNISMATQLRLLRFLQEKSFYPVGRDREVRVDVRVIAATNIDLKEKVKKGEFREDLYFRLLIIDIHLPPLRQRKGDIALLSDHFRQRFAKNLGRSITGISEQAQALLCRYHWPGNVRQLEHAIERACVLCTGTTIATGDLPNEIVQQPPEQNELPAFPEMPEKRSLEITPLRETAPMDSTTAAVQGIINALKRAGGNKAKAARLLGVDRSTLYRKIRELGIDIDTLSL
jgi:two-component system, NtrC family, response regulator HydG